MFALKTVSLVLLAIFMTGAGIMHFVNPDFYLKIMPDYLPLHLELVYLSGVFEMLLGVALLIPRLRRLAAWGVIALLVAIFPANIYAYQHQELLPAPPLLHLLRLPLQGVFILWAYWHTRPDAGSRTTLTTPLSLLAGGLTLLVLSSGQLVQAAERTPNVLLILGDDHAAYALSCYGHPVVRTPQLDRLAARGARFEHAYCNSPMCTPSRQSLLTGRMPHATGVTLLKSVLGEEEVTLAEVLTAAGYRTAAIGKMHFNSPLTHGFAERVDQAQHRQYLKAHAAAELPADAAVLGPWRPFRDSAREWLNSAALPFAARDADMPGTYFADQAAHWIRETDEPFFLTVSFYEPHSPFHFPLEYAGRVSPEQLPVPVVGPEDPLQIPLIFRDLTDAEKQGITAAYYTSVEYLDKNIGLVLDALEASGRAAETLVIYAGDHGYQLGHHGRFEKHTFYEEAIRAPLLMAWPNKIAPGQAVDELVEFVDLFPTVVTACQAELPPDRHGRSLLPLVDGSPAAPPLHQAVFGIYGENEEAMIRTRDWKLIYCSGTRARDDGYATDNPTPGRTVRLYNLIDDPHEMHNLAGDSRHMATVAALKQQLADRLASTSRPGLQAPTNLSLDEVLDWYVFPAELRPAPATAAP